MIRSLIVLILCCFPTFAQQVMLSAKLTSCNANSCTKLISDEIHRSNISPNILAFGEATVEIFGASTPSPGEKPSQSFRAGDGYYDLEEQILVLRDLRDSKHKELLYNLTTNTISYF